MTTTSGPIDWDALVDKLGGEPGFIADLLGVVIASNSTVPEALLEAAKAADLPVIERLAHRVKGMAGDVVAPECHALARDTELAARNRETAAGEMAVRLAASLEALLCHAKAYLASASK
jgi:HPt (histidine-containing phosphotransfer) domain-containing protein